MMRKRPSKARRAELDAIAKNWASIAAVGEAKGRSSARAISAVMLEGDALREYQEGRALQRQISRLEAVAETFEHSDKGKKGYRPRDGGRLLAKFYKQRVAEGEPANYEDVMDDVRESDEYQKNRYVRDTCSYDTFRRVVRAIKKGTLADD